MVLLIQPFYFFIGEMKHIPLLEKQRTNNTIDVDEDRELLVVLEGKITPKIESILLSLLQYDTFVLKNNGQLATRERKIRIVLETGEDLSCLTPALSSFFRLHKCSNKDITWKHSLASKIYQLTTKNEALSSSYNGKYRRIHTLINVGRLFYACINYFSLCRYFVNMHCKCGILHQYS